MAKNANLWLKADSASSEVAKIAKQYGDIVTSANKISSLMKATVGVNGKWYDENAAIFANWWDQSKGSSVTGGQLVFNAETKQLQIKGGSASDGEDKIKFIIQLAAKMFHTGVCAPMATLYPSNKKAIEGKKNLKNSASLGSNKTYLEKVNSSSVSGTKLSTMMEKNYSNAVAWKSVKLPITPLGVSNTNPSELDTLAKNVANELKTMDEKLETFTAELKKVVQNQDKTIWWGCSSATNIITSINEYDKKTDNLMTSFKNSLTAALQASSSTTSDDLAKLESLTF